MVGSQQVGSRWSVGSRIAGGLLALALVAAACGDDDGNGTDGPDPDAPPTEVPENGNGDPDAPSEPLDEDAATEAIVTALDGFLGGETDAEALAWVVGGDDERFAEIYTEITDRTREIALPVQSGNVAATFAGDDRANFTFDLVASETGDTLIEDQAGDAMLVDGTWLITATTVCDIGGLGAADLVTDCLARAAEAEAAATG